MIKKGWSKERIDNEYAVEEGTIADGTSDASVDLGSIELAQKALIINDSNSKSMTVRFNSIANDAFTIKAGEVYKHTLFEFQSLFLSNSSGSAIDYRIMVQGL